MVGLRWVVARASGMTSLSIVGLNEDFQSPRIVDEGLYAAKAEVGLAAHAVRKLEVVAECVLPALVNLLKTPLDIKFCMAGGFLCYFPAWPLSCHQRQMQSGVMLRPS